MRESSEEAEGIVKKLSLVIIFELTSLLNSFTCFLIYRRKASLDHRPKSMMVKTEISAKYMAMAAPLLVECNPISFAVNPNVSGPTAVAARRNFLRSSVPVNNTKDPSDKRNLFTVSAELAPG